MNSPERPPAYSVLFRPSEFPHGFLVRRFWATEDGHETEEKPWAYATALEAARLILPPGLTSVAPVPVDDPCVMESWA